MKRESRELLIAAIKEETAKSPLDVKDSISGKAVDETLLRMQGMAL